MTQKRSLLCQANLSTLLLLLQLVPQRSARRHCSRKPLAICNQHGNPLPKGSSPIILTFSDEDKVELIEAVEQLRGFGLVGAGAQAALLVATEDNGAHSYMQYENAIGEDKPGDTRWLNNVARVSITAHWDEGRRTDLQSFTVMPGYAIKSYRLNNTSENHGNLSVSMSGGPVSFASLREMQNEYDSAIKAAREADDHKAVVDLQNRRKQNELLRAEFETTAPTIQLQASAKSDGNFFDRWRAWATADLDVEVVYVGG